MKTKFFAAEIARCCLRCAFFWVALALQRFHCSKSIPAQKRHTACQ